MTDHARIVNGTVEAPPADYDVFRLDCAVDALRDADLSPYREELIRIRDNLDNLMETANGNAH